MNSNAPCIKPVKVLVTKDLDPMLPERLVSFAEFKAEQAKKRNGYSSIHLTPLDVLPPPELYWPLERIREHPAAYGYMKSLLEPSDPVVTVKVYGDQASTTFEEVQHLLQVPTKPEFLRLDIAGGVIDLFVDCPKAKELILKAQKAIQEALA